MINCSICSTEIKRMNRLTFGSGKLSDGGEVCTTCWTEISDLNPTIDELAGFTTENAIDLFSGEKDSKQIIIENARKSAKKTKEKEEVEIQTDKTITKEDGSNNQEQSDKKKKPWKQIILVIIIGFFIIPMFFGDGVVVPQSQREFIDEWKRLKELDDTSSGEKHLKENRSRVDKWYGKVIKPGFFQTVSQNELLVSYKGIEFTLHPALPLDETK